MCDFDGQILHAYIILHLPCVIHRNCKYCEDGIACARGFIFEIEIDMIRRTSMDFSTI